MEQQVTDQELLEHYTDLLDDLEKNDPETYKKVMEQMQAQVMANIHSGDSPDASKQTSSSDADFLNLLKQSAQNKPNEQEFKPRFPGDKVMDEQGLKPQQQGVYIDVTPGFVMKTIDLKTSSKVFVNFCSSSSIQTFSERKKLDDQGQEQEGLHVPLSLGAAHQVQDKAGKECTAYDVAVNPQVLEDCKSDKTGTFRNFVCELAIEYIDQKYKVKLDARYKLPRLKYCGPLPPPKHYIRKVQTPVIEEVSTSSKPPAARNKQSVSSKQQRMPTIKTVDATINFEVYELSSAMDNKRARQLCSRKHACMEGGVPLSLEMLQQAPSCLEVHFHFQSTVSSANAINLELAQETVSIDLADHHSLTVYLPYPVVVDTAEATLNVAKKTLELKLVVDKNWDTSAPDVGSAPWLLAHALESEGNDPQQQQKSQKQTSEASEQKEEKPKTLEEIFHLLPQSTTSPNTASPGATPTYDPVDEDEELPEDAFHRKDMMSMHILEQRKAEKRQKQQEADAKRKAHRQEVEAKRKQAQEAGKTWAEMFPNEPETTFVDMEDIVEQQQQQRQQQQQQQFQGKQKAEEDTGYVPTEAALKAAAAWSETKAKHGIELQSALGFELL